MVSGHWSARLSVYFVGPFVYTAVELSRANREVLRHLLSFIYDADTDTYDAICAWINPYDPDDVVLTASLVHVGRHRREKLYHQLVADCEITVGENGRCERDAVKLASALYLNFRQALRSVYSTERPARPILFFDGTTGGSLGKGISHGHAYTHALLISETEWSQEVHKNHF